MSDQSISLFGYDDCANLSLYGYAECNPEGTIRERRPFVRTVSYTLVFNVRSRVKTLPIIAQFNLGIHQKLHRKIQFNPRITQKFSVNLAHFSPAKRAKIAVKMAYLPVSDRYHSDHAVFVPLHTDKVSVTVVFSIIPDLDALDL